MSETSAARPMNIYLATTFTVSWYICYPVGIVLYYLAVAIVFVLKLLYRPVAFLLQPVVYFGRFVIACLIAPFELLGRFETVYIYLGIAALIGVTIGLVLRYLYTSISRLLRFDTEPETLPARTAREYREAKRKEQIKAEAPLISSGSVLQNGTSSSPLSPTYLSMSDSAKKVKRSRGLLNQTIAEEMESDY